MSADGLRGETERRGIELLAVWRHSPNFEKEARTSKTRLLETVDV